MSERNGGEKKNRQNKEIKSKKCHASSHWNHVTMVAGLSGGRGWTKRKQKRETEETIDTLALNDMFRTDGGVVGGHGLGGEEGGDIRSGSTETKLKHFSCESVTNESCAEDAWGTQESGLLCQMTSNYPSVSQ